MAKTDFELGKRVHNHLKTIGLETPMADQTGLLNTDLMKSRIQGDFESIMKTLRLDLSDDSLQDTPRRVADMFVDELYSGLDYTNFPKCTAIENKMSRNSSFVLCKDVALQSSCEHHFVTIDGFAHVAYIPGKYVLGLSKINRLVQFFARRPQVQERLTEQICAAIQYITMTEDVAVFIDATHFCVKARGIQDTSSSTVTFAAGGKFAGEKSEVRREFLNIARSS